MSNQNNYVISNNEEAWDFIRKAVTDKNILDNSKIEFKNWPNIVFKFNGERFNDGLLPASIAQSIADLQNDIYKSYKIIRYNDENKRLTDAEKELLEIKVKIEKGSLNILGSLDKIFDKIADRVLEMDTNVQIAVVVAIGLGWTTQKVMSFLSDRQEKNNSHTEEMANIKAQESKDLKDKEIILALANQNPNTERAFNITQESKNRFVKNVKNEDETLSIGNNGKESSAELYTIKDAEALRARGSRRKFNVTETEFNARIIKVDYVNNKNPTIEFLDHNDIKFTASLEISDKTLLDKIKISVGTNESITLVVSARESEEGEYKDLIVVDSRTKSSSSKI